MAAMDPSSAGASSKVKAGGVQPSESTLKRKRGIFQKDCKRLISFLCPSTLYLLTNERAAAAL